MYFAKLSIRLVVTVSLALSKQKYLPYCLWLELFLNKQQTIHMPCIFVHLCQ